MSALLKWLETLTPALPEEQVANSEAEKATGPA
jgi:hypothetical protein